MFDGWQVFQDAENGKSYFRVRIYDAWAFGDEPRKAFVQWLMSRAIETDRDVDARLFELIFEDTELPDASY